jgi:rhamnulokinase
MGPPFHYRDQRTTGLLDKAESLVGLSSIYEATGIQVMAYNTLYQLLAEKSSAAYRQASKLLLIPDLLAYMFTGKARLETTNASTTQLLDARTGELVDWLISALGLRRELFCPPITPGEVLGDMLPAIASAAGLSTLPKLVAVASHDTASAVLSVPALSKGFAYVISGTWSLVGLELEAPLITEKSRRANFSNELGVEGSVRFLKDVMGHWMLQECARAFKACGHRESLSELTTAAWSCEAFRSVVDTELADFNRPGDMPARVIKACQATGEPVPRSDTEIVRCVLDSMALCVSDCLEEALLLAGFELEALHVLGGGAGNELLLSLYATTTGREVLAGPIEASSIGNLCIQLQQAGHLHGREEIRQLIAASFPPRRVFPDPGLKKAAAEAKSRLGQIREKTAERALAPS